MTARSVLATLVRRWYFLLIGLVIVGSLVGWVARTPGVYSTRFNLVLVPPSATTIRNSLEPSQLDLAAMAEIVAVKYNQGRTRPAPASVNVTLADEGIRSGSVVEVSNYGGQWSRSSRPLIDVQVIDTEASAVMPRSRDVQRAVASVLRQEQADLGVRPGDMITTSMVPATPRVSYRAPAKGRAMVATVLAGSALLVVLVVLGDRWAMRRRSGVSCE